MNHLAAHELEIKDVRFYPLFTGMKRGMSSWKRLTIFGFDMHDVKISLDSNLAFRLKQLVCGEKLYVLTEITDLVKGLQQAQNLQDS